MMRHCMGLGTGMGRSKHFADEGREDDGRSAAYLAVEGGAWLSNGELFEETDGVLEAIRRACGRCGTPLTGHAARGGLSPRGRAGRGEWPLRGRGKFLTCGARRKGRCAAGGRPLTRHASRC
jgi:hypothetical protein